MTEVPSTPVEATSPAEPAPEIAKNAKPSAGTPPTKPPNPQEEAASRKEFAALWTSQARAKRLSSASDADELDQFVPDEPAPPLPPLSSEDDKLLFGETLRPQESITAGASPGRHTPPPEQLVNALPTLLRLARRPDASPELLAMIQVIQREML